MSARRKLDCLICGRDVFGKRVKHAHGSRLEVTTVGWCRQCGYGVRRSEVFEAGTRVDAKIVVLAPKKDGGAE